MSQEGDEAITVGWNGRKTGETRTREGGGTYEAGVGRIETLRQVE